MKHSFNAEFAAEHGVNKAILFDYIYLWVQENKKTNKNCHMGKFWTYSSVIKLHQKFSYMSIKQIRKTLNDLEIQGFVESSNHNKTKYDKTKWYTVTSFGIEQFNKYSHTETSCYSTVNDQMSTSNVPNGNIEWSERANRASQKVEPIPITNTITNTSNIEFDNFWTIYDKKVDKHQAHNLFNKLSIDDRKRAFEKLPAYVNSTPDKKYRKSPLKWLKNKCWEDEAYDNATNQGTITSLNIPKLPDIKNKDAN